MSSDDPEELKGRIAALQSEADELACQFKELFRRATAAYKDRDGALAKQLSQEGRGFKVECDRRNEEANRLRARLAAVRRPGRRPVPAGPPPSRAILAIATDHVGPPRPLIKTKSVAKTPVESAQLPEFRDWPGTYLKVRAALATFLIENIPGDHLAGIVDITLVERPPRANAPSSWGGQYLEGGHILIKAPSSEESSLRWFAERVSHEIGHHVFHGISTDCAAAWKNLVSLRVDLYADYHDRYQKLRAEHLRREMFADMCRRYVCDAQKLFDREQWIYQFFMNRVFNGREYLNVLI